MFLIEIGFDKKSRYIISCISGYMLKNGHYFGKKDFEKLFDEIEKNPSDISMCYKLGRHLLVPKGSQDRQNVKKGINFLYSKSMICIKYKKLGSSSFLQG